MAKKSNLTSDEVLKKLGIRDIGFEKKIAAEIQAVEGVVSYEEHKIKWFRPQTNHTYTPDFKLKNGIFIETKGRFMKADRQKHLYIREQYPDIDIRFVFMNPNAKIGKGAKSTYADWCNKYNFKWAKATIPEAWFLEEKNNA